MTVNFRIVRRLTLALSAGSLLLGVSWAVWLVAAAAHAPAEARPARVPWTTSRVTGSPDAPPPYKVVRAFPNLKFHHPLLMARAPGGDRLYVGEQEGVIYSFADKPEAK